MSADNQNFTIFAGDAGQPVFQVLNGGGIAVDISTVTEITWTASRTPGSAPVITKRKSTGGIIFTNTGTDGRFTVLLANADTAAWTGSYVHKATITDAAGNVTTVTTGTMFIGRAPTWTYDPVTFSDKDKVRRLIGDVLSGDQQLQDAEVNLALATYSNLYLAASECCRYLGAQYARLVDLVQGELKTNYSARSKQYLAMAANLYNTGMSRGAGAMPFVGGISVTQKMEELADTDRVTPQFNIGMDDNALLGAGPANQTLPNPAGGNANQDDTTVP